MRGLLKFSCLLILLAVSGVSSADENPKFKVFAYQIFEPELEGVRCRNTFDPRNIINRFGQRGVDTKRWDEPDFREPGVTNYYMRWTYPGLSFQTSTHFTLYGPSTWLSRIEVTSPDYSLQFGLRIGMEYGDFERRLGIPEHARINLSYNSGAIAVKFSLDEEHKVRKLTFYCTSD